tara:strand:- start:152 stop:442 length:291 start_codon:yes stop_codon:yes gene_type:complete
MIIDNDNQLPVDIQIDLVAVFLCSWNDREVVQIHTKQSLHAEYCGTNLYDAPQSWYCLSGASDFECEWLDELLDYMTKTLSYQLWACDNMTIQRIK